MHFSTAIIEHEFLPYLTDLATKNCTIDIAKYTYQKVRSPTKKITSKLVLLVILYAFCVIFAYLKKSAEKAQTIMKKRRKKRSERLAKIKRRGTSQRTHFCAFLTDLSTLRQIISVNCITIMVVL